MKHHFVETRENVSASTSVPSDVREIFIKLFENKEKRRNANNLEHFKEVGTQDGDASAKKGDNGLIC